MSEPATADLIAVSYQAATAHGDPVLTYVDADGRPASVRVTVHRASGGLDVTLPDGAPAPVDGPANLLAHSHDEQLWTLQQTMVRGRVQIDGDTLRFVPGKVVPGARPGLRGAIKTLRQCRRSAAAELERRGLERPTVPWDAVKRIAERAADR